MHRTHRVAAGLLLAAAGFTLAARSYAWHRVDQTGFTSVTGTLDLALVSLALVVLASGVALAIREERTVEAAAAFAAVVLASMLVAALLSTGEGADKPDSGAWLAGVAVVLLGASVVALRVRSRVAQTIVIAALAGLALGAVLAPPDRPLEEIEVIR